MNHYTCTKKGFYLSTEIFDLAFNVKRKKIKNLLIVIA